METRNELKKPSDYPSYTIRITEEQKKKLIELKKKHKSVRKMIDIWIKALEGYKDNDSYTT